MAYKSYSEQYFSAWDSYVGAYEVGTWTFRGPPEQVAPASIVSSIVSGYISQFRLHGEALLYMKVEVDAAPTFETKYRVTTYSHDSPFPQVLVYAIIAMVIVIGLAYITHVMSPAIKSAAENFPKLINLGFWAIAATVALGSLWLIFGGKERKRDGKR
jgi:hypothetical protein